jgi:CHAT domain-containing protein
MSDALGEYYRGPYGDRIVHIKEARRGIPVADNGPLLERALLEYFLPAQLRDRLSRDSSPRSLLFFPALPVPIQTILQREVGISAPLESSLCTAALDRSVKVVSVWLGETIYTECEIEVLEAASRSRGWKLKITVPPKEGDPTAFRLFYEDPEADVLWVIGHGAHSAYSEEQTGIYLNERRLLSVQEIAKYVQPNAGRRLLILNTCSGATARMTGGLARIGLAQQLIGPAQAIVAHIWPAPSETALSFGALLASTLGTRDNFSAFAAATAFLRKPRSIVRALERELGSGLRAYERIRNSADKLDNVLSWGCPVFLT